MDMEPQEDEEQIPMKCRKCRCILLLHPDVRVEDVHGMAFDPASIASTSPQKPCSSEVWYIPEDCAPSWMKVNLEKGGWVKGKLNCPKCDARIGSYNFVSGFKCPCGSRVVPPIHLVKSKVDFKEVFHIHLQKAVDGTPALETLEKTSCADS